VVVHDRLGFVVLALAGVGAVWALVSLSRPDTLPALRAYLRLTTLTVAVQGLIGIALVISGRRPDPLHWFYGAATLLALPLAMFIGSRLSDREEHVWVLGGAVATLLFALRAVTTG